MINRLTYEVRLRKSVKKKTLWRWDVVVNKTTDPEFPGVETGREQLTRYWGYERFRFQAVRNIIKHMEDNPFKKEYKEV